MAELVLHFAGRDTHRLEEDGRRVGRKRGEIFGVEIARGGEAFEILLRDEGIRIEEVHASDEYDDRQECAESESVVSVFNQDLVEQPREYEAKEDDESVGI